MSYILTWLIALIAVITCSTALNILFRQSYNFLFFMMKRPIIWIMTVALLGFLFAGLSSMVQQPFGLGVATWSLIVATVRNFPPKSALTREEADAFSGVRRSQMKYGLGLTAFALGGLAGWILFYGALCSPSPGGL